MAQSLGGKKYIHANDQVNPMNIDKPLMYVTIQYPIQWDLDNLDCVMIAPGHPWDPVSINDALEDSAVFSIDNDFDNNLYN